jgi:hypothetical protein
MALQFTEQRSALINNSYREYLDIDRVKKLLKLDLSKIFGYNTEVCIEYKKTLNKLLELTNENGYFDIQYNQPDKLGRVYPNKLLSISQLPRAIRHTLLKDYYIDFDIVCAQPSILNQFCLKHKIPNTYLAEYVENRDDKLKEISELFNCELDEAKELFNSLPNGGTLKYWLDTLGLDKDITKPKFIELYEEQIFSIREEIRKANFALSNKLYKKISKEDTFNIDGKVFSRFIQDLEKQCLEAMIIPQLTYNDTYYISLCHDGLLVLYDTLEKNCITKQELCYLFEKSIREKLGFDVKVIVKPFDLAIDIDSIESDCDSMCSDDIVADQIVKDDNEACDILFNRLKDILISYNGRLFYKRDNIWIDNSTSLIDDCMLLYITNSRLYKLNEKGKIKPYSQNKQKAIDIRSLLFSKIKTENNDPKLYDKFHSTTKGRLCFLDGVLDIPSKTFYKWNEIKFDYYTLVQIQRKFGDYFNNPNHELINLIRDIIFIPMYGDNTQIALEFLSRAIAGHAEDKNWGFYLGNRNCGKGMQYDLLESGFGSYVKPFELGNILYSAKTVGTENIDCSKKLYWLLDLEFVRLGISQEIPDISTGLKCNSKILKKIAGGGDTIVARRNFDRFDSHIKLDTTFYILGNNSLLSDNNDCFEHCVEFNSVCQFKTLEQIEDLRANGASELELKRYFIKDDTLRVKCKTDEYANAIVYLLLINYSNKPIKVTRETYDDDEISLLETIKNCYEITYNPNDYVLVKELENTLSKFDKKKISNELLALNVFKKKSKQRDSSRDKLCYFGISKKAVEDKDLPEVDI